jgi:hypothetical protein
MYGHCYNFVQIFSFMAKSQQSFWEKKPSCVQSWKSYIGQKKKVENEKRKGSYISLQKGDVHECTYVMSISSLTRAGTLREKKKIVHVFHRRKKLLQ